MAGWEGSADEGSRGSSCMGTESRYGSISRSTSREASRFFHFEGVADGIVANRDTGNGADEEEGTGDDVVNC